MLPGRGQKTAAARRLPAAAGSCCPQVPLPDVLSTVAQMAERKKKKKGEMLQP